MEVGFSPLDNLFPERDAHEAVVVHAPCFPNRKGTDVLAELLSHPYAKITETLEAQVVCCGKVKGGRSIVGLINLMRNRVLYFVLMILPVLLCLIHSIYVIFDFIISENKDSQNKKKKSYKRIND